MSTNKNNSNLNHGNVRKAPEQQSNSTLILEHSSHSGSHSSLTTYPNKNIQNQGQANKKMQTQNI